MYRPKHAKPKSCAVLRRDGGVIIVAWSEKNHFYEPDEYLTQLKSFLSRATGNLHLTVKIEFQYFIGSHVLSTLRELSLLDDVSRAIQWTLPKLEAQRLNPGATENRIAITIKEARVLCGVDDFFLMKSFYDVVYQHFKVDDEPLSPSERQRHEKATETVFQGGREQAAREQEHNQYCEKMRDREHKNYFKVLPTGDIFQVETAQCHRLRALNIEEPPVPALPDGNAWTVTRWHEYFLYELKDSINSSPLATIQGDLVLQVNGSWKANGDPFHTQIHFSRNHIISIQDRLELFLPQEIAPGHSITGTGSIGYLRYREQKTKIDDMVVESMELFDTVSMLEQLSHKKLRRPPRSSVTGPSAGSLSSNQELPGEREHKHSD